MNVAYVNVACKCVNVYSMSECVNVVSVNVTCVNVVRVNVA